jgi:hypothetical protein
MRLMFRVEKFVFQGQEYLLATPKGEQHYKPMEYARMAVRMQDVFGKPLVYRFNSLDYNQRNRLVAQGVYFIVSGLYVSLPNLLLATKVTEKKPVKKTVAKKTAATKKKVTAGRKKTGSGTPRKTKKRAGSSSEK